MNSSCNIIFPHQLFKDFILPKNNTTYLIEEYLFFNQYKFHKQKILFHRGTMKYYEKYLKDLEIDVVYINSVDKNSDIRILISEIIKNKFQKIEYIDTVDYLLEKRINFISEKNNIDLNKHESLLFMNSNINLDPFFKKTKKKFFQTTFYIQQRKNHNILIDNNQNPEGGQWSYDALNREKYPKEKEPPKVSLNTKNFLHTDAEKYVNQNFKANYGNLNSEFFYPNTHSSAEKWFDDFLKNRLDNFGKYEDAIVENELILNHSLLSPLMNVGLISPNQVINKAISYTKKNNIPLNSIEGFVRQIIGWREFIRGIYVSKGSEERTKNFWGFSKKIPNSFYTGETGITPIDSTIKKINDYAYCHHIERLMVLGNFMLLCEFDPDDVYKWFMEMFIDSYDWVMVPNVYGMSQFSDGGLMSTKPYISSSNYLFKMSNYNKKDKWIKIWDSLFWRFMDVHRTFFIKNPRMRMLVNTYDKMQNEKKTEMRTIAETYLKSLE